MKTEKELYLEWLHTLMEKLHFHASGCEVYLHQICAQEQGEDFKEFKATITALRKKVRGEVLKKNLKYGHPELHHQNLTRANNR